jgi:hypothetical protein
MPKSFKEFFDIEGYGLKKWKSHCWIYFIWRILRLCDVEGCRSYMHTMPKGKVKVPLM